MNLTLAVDPPALLHNMSAPPKSVVRYSGLSGLVRQSGPSGSEETSLRYSNVGQHGSCVRFEWAAHLPIDNPGEILASLGLAHESTSADSAARHLVQRINKRAAELPLPEGCAVVKSLQLHEMLWPDPLAALAVLTKCTDTVWLRAKTPTLSKLTGPRCVSLLIPPGFIDAIRKAQFGKDQS
jgi:hypothetical protein